MPPCRRVESKSTCESIFDPPEGERHMRRSGDKQRCDREVAVDMLPCCRRGTGVAGAARRDHEGYSDAPGRPVLPDGGTLPRLAHAEKNLKRHVQQSHRRVGPRDSSCPVPFSHIHKLTLASQKEGLNP